MSKRLFLSVGLLPLGAMAVACLLVAVALIPAPIRLGARDSGHTVRVAASTPVVVRLAENPSTGFRWKLLAPLDARVLRLVSHRYEAPPKGAPLGAAGVSVWRFSAAGRGTVRLRLGYLRSWEPRKVVRRFRIDVRVS